MLPLLMLAGTALSAYGKYKAGQAAGDALEQQAMQNRIAAVRRRLKATDDARMIREEGERFRERQAVGFAKSGVLLDSGSPLLTIMDTATRVERNALKTMLAGQWDAESYEAGASAYGLMADSARRAGTYGAVGSFIGGATAMQGLYKPGSPSTGVREEPWMREYGND